MNRVCRRTITSTSLRQAARPYKPVPRNAPKPSNAAPPAETLLDHWRSAWLPLSGAAVLAGFLGFYILGTTTASLRKPSPSCACEHTPPTGRPPALTGDNAERFDRELDLPEWWMGVTALRRRLAREARGHVLEIAVGSGRNLEYYPWDALSAAAEQASSSSSSSSSAAAAAAAASLHRKRLPPGISSFTGLDISPDMLAVAHKKLLHHLPPTIHPLLNTHLRLIHADAHQPLPPPHSPRAEGKYDTVAQTFGLCSVADPVGVLCNLATVVRPDTGRIILLEHGKGWSGLVNGLLDKNAGRHFDKYGCWWNRDIEAIVDQAVEMTPGLEVVRVERPKITQLGTLVWVELRVKDMGL